MNLRLMLIFLLCFTAAGCGGKSGKTSTSFSVNMGAISTGAALDGGLVMRGTSSLGHEFFIPTTNANDVSIALPNGTWDFYVIGWKNQANGAMTGDNVCGAQLGVQLNGGDTAVNFNLNMANCALAQVAGPESFTTALPTGGFKMNTFISCLTIAGMVGDHGAECDSSTISKKHGVSTFLRVELNSVGNFPIPDTTLGSSCLALDTYTATQNFKSSKFTSSLRLPVQNGSTIPFPIHMITYEDPTCDPDEEDITYYFPHGFGGVPDGETASTIIGEDGSPADDTSARIVFADNYLGIADSAFRPTSGVANDVILPYIDCNGARCENAAIPTTYSSVFPRNNVSEVIFDLFGTDDQISAYDSEHLSDASVTIDGIDFTTSTEGSSGNSFSITIAASTFSVHSASYGSFTIDNDSSQTRAQVVTAVNALTGSTSITATCSAACATTFTEGPGTNNFSGGVTNLTKERRDQGTVPEIKELLLGPIGGILFQNGLTTLADVCTNTGSFSKEIVTEGTPEIVTVDLTAGDVQAPDYMTTSNSTNFDRKVVLSLDGVDEFAIQFNCPGGTNGDTATLWFYEEEEGDSEDGASFEEVFLNHGSVSSSAVELVEYREDVGGSVESLEWTYFQKTSPTAYEIFSIEHYAGSAYFGRTGASVDMAGFNFNVNDYGVTFNDTDAFFSSTPDNSCTYTSFTDAGTCGSYATTDLPTSLTGPGGSSISAPMVYGGAFDMNSLYLIDPLTDFTGF
ncbi:MAG: hypothetical protein CME70_04105 [Halobacteriovorax sp.]|nr:hypothetical protein [Halobacteriovorax sp.]|tara:strand:+ start:88962 stop:91184 length:2223 start_codon:yes stop_codon:yes gene_type:complete